ncbi:hypothetical protein BLA24_20400 [Streptomyces cinnamoneus]|uniref:4Fe-4S Wbl-type domain-containing protein n=1 Tax=Streptomyces cinnamoneus TaxID=53446 RepID=A0A2G1XFG8_STRCJ|nr:WhiB family transcriptional regulator [Streptomyces cinnamoneus]PHQ49978.1 hypothetical protein BLA24_20400 [Streptomyces cinnamoneus]PPT13245.1 WhiB family transcriptional regulator [Streptomyces cinnamoneus]
MATSLIGGTRTAHLVARPSGATLAFELAPDPGLAGALCVAVEPELFFPEKGDHKTANLAREICARCPVIEACLADALKMEGGRSHSSRFGIRGGLTPNQRYQLSRRMRQSASASEAASRPVEVSTVPERKPAPCGTRRGYLRHRREGENACEACLNHAAGGRRRLTAGTAEGAAA